MEQAPVVDSFCKAYNRVNRSGQDAVEIRRLPQGIKARVDGNDVLYLCKCEAWDNPICGK